MKPVRNDTTPRPADTVALVLHAGERLAAFSIRNDRDSSTWVRAGHADVRSNGSIVLVLDVLPLDGRLYLRVLDGEGGAG